MNDESPTEDLTKLQERKAEVMGLVALLGHVLTIMGTLAAPRVFARLPPERLPEWREPALRAVDDFLARFSEIGSMAKGNGPQTEETTRQARAMLETWAFSGEPPAALVRAARDFHAAFFGLAEPPGGWDAYDLPEEDEAAAGDGSAFSYT